MRKLKRGLSVVLSMIMFACMVFAVPMEVKATRDITAEDYVFSWRYELVIDDENQCEDVNDITVPTDYCLIINKSYSFSGTMTLNSNSCLNIDENGSITSGTIVPSQMAILNIAKPSGAAGFTLYAADESSLYDVSKIDGAEFEYHSESGKWVERIPECGLMLQTANTMDKCEYITYTLKKGDTVIKEATRFVPIAPEDKVWEDSKVLFDDELKQATDIEFHVVAKTGYTINTNGIRFGEVNNVISDDNDIKDGDAICSYHFENGVDRLYTLEVEFVSPDDVMKFATFNWTRDPAVLQANWQQDQYVDHGDIRIVSATKGGVSVVSSGDIDNPPYYSAEMDHYDEDGHEWQAYTAIFEIGTEVVVEIVPDRGYQLTRFTLSGVPGQTESQGAVNTYKFTIIRPVTFHLGAVFTRTNDEVDASGATGVTGGNVSFAEGEVSKGTVALNVNNASSNPTEEARFEQMASADGYTVSKTLNINAEQRFYKGVENATRSQCWVQPISQELSAPARIELNVSGIDGTDVAVLHNHNGRYEVIPATYSDGKIKFSTDSFSDFAIISKGGKSSSDSTESSGSETTPEEEEETLGNVVGGLSVKNWGELDKVLASKSTLKSGNKKSGVKNNGQLIQLVLKNSNATVPASTFAALSATNDQGLHLFTGNGTAITFINDNKLVNQKAVNLSCTTTSVLGRKTVQFKNYAKLSASTILHSTVPAGTKKILIYFTGKDGVRRLFGTVIPTDRGLFCFAITELGKYEFVY